MTFSINDRLIDKYNSHRVITILAKHDSIPYYTVRINGYTYAESIKDLTHRYIKEAIKTNKTKNYLRMEIL